jgi:hypothetical protein
MPGLLRGIARTAIVAGTATAVSNRVARRQAGRWARDYEQEAPPAMAPQPPAGGSDVIAQLKDLGDLRAQGVLTDAEFEAQKRRILG